MPPPLPPWQRQCDCGCPRHHRQTRLVYNHPGCACTITCATQPLTLLSDHWGGALFLGSTGDLWYVAALPDGAWAWETAGGIDTRSGYHQASVTIEHLLRTAAHVLASPRT